MFDAKHALDVVLPLAEQAYGWTGTGAIQPGAFGFVVHVAGTTTVSFRGTQDEGDWLKDFDAVGVPNFYGEGTVHKGFQEVYTAIRPSLIELTGTSAGSVVITGHSLGAALAVLCASDLVRAGWTPTVVTWAGPRVGYEDFVGWYNRVVPGCDRVVNKWDIVPHLPSAVEGYRHVGREVEIDGGQPLGRGVEVFHTAHNLEKSYRPGMEKLVRA